LEYLGILLSFDRRAACQRRSLLRASEWLLAQAAWIVPIPELTKPHRLKESLGAAEMELTAGD
jgi:aryl-alcohol dehydrogenase-like predicted oxidoreductase